VGGIEDPTRAGLHPQRVAVCVKVFDRGDLRVLQVGTSPNKNLERVIPALAGIPCRLQIIGELDASQRRLLSEHQIRYEAASHVTRRCGSSGLRERRRSRSLPRLPRASVYLFLRLKPVGVRW